MILYGISWLMNFTQHFIMATVAPSISRRMRTDITNKTQTDWGEDTLTWTPFGDILSRITNDIDTIEHPEPVYSLQFITSIALRSSARL